MRTYIAPLGYDSTRVTRPVLSRGIERSDRLEILRPAGQSENRRASEALNDVTRLVDELEPRIDVDVVELPVGDFHAALLECITLVNESEGEVVVVLGGGARDILVPLCIAVLTQRDVVDSVLQFSDVTGSVNELEVPNLFVDLTDSQCATLVGIAESSSPVTLAALDETLNHSKSTIARHVSHFDDLGFVETRTEGRTKVVELESAGEVYLATEQLSQPFEEP